MKNCLAAGLLLISVIAWAEGPADTVNNPVALRVNGDPVYTAALRIALQNLTAQQVQAGGEAADQEQLTRYAMQQVVDRKLLAQEAARREIIADAKKIEQTMQQIISQAGGREALDASLGQLGMTYEQLTAEVTETQIVQDLVVSKLQPAITVTDSQVQEFYSSNPDQFKVPPQVRARHILLKVNAGDTDEQREQARTGAEQAHKRALAGEDFAALAKELSQCPSASKGGDLGFFTAQRMVKPFSDAAFALDPGEISGVVSTQFGYHVIKAEEQRQASTRPLTEVRKQIHQNLVNQGTGGAVEQLLVKLRAEAEIVPVSRPATAESSQ